MASSANERDVDVNFPVEEDYEHLIEDYSHLAPPSEGELLQGHVVKVTPQEVIVDFGYKLEGLVPIEQVRQPDGTVPVKAGDAIDVMIDRHGPQPEGYVLLSLFEGQPPAHLGHAGTRHARAASGIRARDRTHQGRIDGGRGRARVHARIAGGHAADSRSGSVRRPGYPGQGSQDQSPARQRGGFAQDGDRGGSEGRARQRALEHLFEGAVVTGTVKNLTEYGAFVDLGGIDGLLHVSDMSHGRVNHPSEVVHVGDEITVKVLKFDRDKERISLGLRQLTPDPWETLPRALSRRQPRDRPRDEHHRLRRFRRNRAGRRGPDPHLRDDLEPPDEASQQSGEGGRSGGSGGARSEAAGPPRFAGDQATGSRSRGPPWRERYSIGSVVEGRVRKLADFGAFLEIEEGVDGLVHVSDLSWTKHVKASLGGAAKRAR